ncbi:MAG: 1,4-dihydroxy-2-naphthoate octaprenyltransferase [Fidelibacterota bacterium]
MKEKKWKLYLQEMRAPFFTASIVPLLLGSAIAWSTSDAFHWGYFILTLIGGVLLHAGTNVANDYFDHKSGNDEVNFEFVRPYTGGSRMIQLGKLTPGEVITESLILFLLGSIIGIYLTFQRGSGVLYLGMIGVFSGFFYTAPPFKIGARGIGEVFVGLNFGVLMTLGAYYVQTQHFAIEPAIAALPISFLITGVLYINEFQDYEADKQTGKKHMVVLLGKKRAVKGFELIIGFTYLSIALGVAFRLISPFALLGFLTIPIALKSARTAKKYYDQYLKLTPANVGTIFTHMLTGFLITIGYLIDKAI